MDPTGSEGHRLRRFDSFRFGFCHDDLSDDDDDDNLEDAWHQNNTNEQRQLQRPVVQSGRSVKSIEFHRFRAMLIDNFNIAFHENKLKWPRRFAKNSKPVPILAG